MLNRVKNVASQHHVQRMLTSHAAISKRLVMANVITAVSMKNRTANANRWADAQHRGDMQKELEELLHRHREKSMFCCEETCLCWDIEEILAKHEAAQHNVQRTANPGGLDDTEMQEGEWVGDEGSR